MMSQTPVPQTRDWAMVALLGVIWGTSFLFIEIALRGLTPFWIATSRITLAGLVTAAIWQWRGGKLFVQPPTTQDRSRLIAVSILSSALPFMLISWGQQYTTSGFAGVSMAGVALVVLPIAHFLVPGEQMNLRKTLGFLIGFAGAVVLIGGQAFESSGASLELAGRLAIFAAASCYALSSVQVRLLPAVDTIGLSAVTLLIGAVFVGAAAVLVEGIPELPNSTTLWALLFLGLFPTAAANLQRISIIRSAGPTFMSLANYQVPVWSVIFGFVFLGEDLPPSLLIALVLILCGVALSQWNSLRRLFER